MTSHKPLNRRTFLKAALALGGWAALESSGLNRIACTAAGSGPVEVFYQGKRRLPYIALTFDDCVYTHLLHTLEQAGDRRSWFTLRMVLSTHCYATVSLPTRDGKLYRLRKPGVPEVCQWDVYRKLGIRNLHRLPRTKTVAAVTAELAGTGATM